MHECGQQKKLQKKLDDVEGGILAARLLFASQFDNFLRVFLQFFPTHTPFFPLQNLYKQTVSSDKLRIY